MQPCVEPRGAARYLGPMRMLRLALCLALLAGPASAWAQQNVIVVPRDAQVVVPARGAVAPARTLPPAPARAEALPTAPAGPPTVLAPGAVGLAPVAGIALPLIAGAIFAGTLPGSGGGGSAPSRTR
jgi:hypothetical protein